MRTFFVSLLLFFSGTFYSYSQYDTTKVVTDTGIVYIIKKPPVRIKHVVEIIRKRLDGHIYLSINAGIHSGVTERKIKNPLYEEYFRLSAENTKNKIGYIQSIELIRAPRNYIWILHVDWCRINEQYTLFHGPYSGGTAEHRYNYGRVGLNAGYWFGKGKRHSFMPNAGLSLDFLSSNAGTIVGMNNYVYHKNEVVKDVVYYSYLFWDFKTRQAFSSVHLNVKYLLRIKNKYVELAPFFSTNLVNLMQKQEVFSEWRSIYGIRIGFVQNIF